MMQYVMGYFSAKRPGTDAKFSEHDSTVGTRIGIEIDGCMEFVEVHPAATETEWHKAIDDAMGRLGLTELVTK